MQKTNPGYFYLLGQLKFNFGYFESLKNEKSSQSILDF